MEKKVALVTGASRGIGRQISLTLAKEGMFVVVNYCGSEARAKNVLEEIRKNGGDGVLYQCDVADYQQTEAMAKELIKSYGHVDVLVNNAGITRDNLILRMSEEEFDVGTLLAQTWNLDLVRELGEMIGHEMELFGITLWLAPGMNIHRNPLCGRNFEYYSEDPLLAGMMAASMTLGVQKVPGCGTTIKHYACNNQEDNRMGSDSILSERTLREIYLKGFEIAIKDAQPMSIMTSYNLINGVHAANCYDTCTKAARDEWGFAGAIMTDWTTTNVQIQGECTAAGCMRAGNDMVMPGMEEDHENIRKELKEGTLDIRELKRCIYNTVNIILQSNQYEEAVSYENQFDGLGEWLTVK